MVHGGDYKDGRTSAGLVVQETRNIVVKNPVILLLFFVLAVIDYINLTALFLSHSFPFSKVLAPIIRRLWGDRFLHYPDNLFLLPKLFGYAHVLVLLTFGLFVTAVTIKLIQGDMTAKSKMSSLDAAGVALKKYFGMALIWLVSFFGMRGIGRLITDHMQDMLLLQIIVFWVVFLIIQVLLSFLFPALVSAEKGFFKPVMDGIFSAVKNFWLLLKLLVVPVGLSVGMSFLKAFAPAFIHINPELILVVMIVSIAVSVAVDLFITTATAVSFLKIKGSKI